MSERNREQIKFGLRKDRFRKLYSKEKRPAPFLLLVNGPNTKQNIQELYSINSIREILPKRKKERKQYKRLKVENV